MKISKFYDKTVEFFRKHKTRYGCIAALEKMLLTGFDEEKMASERIIPYVDQKTQHVPVYDTAVPYVREMWERQERERQDRLIREEMRRLRNRPPRRK